MTDFIKKFHRNETGAVTVDWVVLTTAVVGLAAALVVMQRNGSVGVSAGVEAFMTNFF